MTKVYNFQDDSWWNNPPCDCCSSDLMICYNCGQTVEELGSAHTEEECYAQALAHYLALDGEYLTLATLHELFSEQPLEYLVQLSDKLDIVVEIEENYFNG